MSIFSKQDNAGDQKQETEKKTDLNTSQENQHTEKTAIEKKTAPSKKKRLIIEGITHSGQRFRPSDWAERMSGNLSTFRKHRLFYSPLLHPGFYKGNKCVLLDKQLKETNPKLYRSILKFAKENKLRICGEEEKNDGNT